MIARYGAKELHSQFQDKNLCSPAMIKSLKFKSGPLKAILTLKRAGFPRHTKKKALCLHQDPSQEEARTLLENRRLSSFH